MVAIAIIGPRGNTTNRNIHSSPYTIDTYNSMCSVVIDKIKSLGYSNTEVDLISGGCSFSDHVAITCFNLFSTTSTPFKSLTIYSPCQWNYVSKCYLEKQNTIHQRDRYTKNSCAVLLNSLHREFSNQCYDSDSLYHFIEEIQELL